MNEETLEQELLYTRAMLGFVLQTTGEVRIPESTVVAGFDPMNEIYIYKDADRFELVIGVTNGLGADSPEDS